MDISLKIAALPFRVSLLGVHILLVASNEKQHYKSQIPSQGLWKNDQFFQFSLVIAPSRLKGLLSVHKVELMHAMPPGSFQRTKAKHRSRRILLILVVVGSLVKAGALRCPCFFKRIGMMA